MAVAPTSVREYCSLLARSKLLPGDEVDALYRKWKDEKGAGDDQIDAFGRYLVKKQCLTGYQAVMLQRGHADGFFLGGYKILDRIGKGQMAGVYKAVHTLGQLVALKILPASKAKDAHTLARFQREARLAAQLDHPNVARAFQVGEAGSIHYIVMEYLEGETLDEVIARRKKFPVGEAVRIIRQGFDGLQHLHDKRMVHRDVKPANLMLTPPPTSGRPDTTWEQTLRVLDIGLGRELFDENAPAGDVETQLTVEGAMLGTPDYLAPEQARDARIADIRADVYSLGCVLYHCLTGRPPFPDANVMTQIIRHATERPTPLYTFMPDVPPGLQTVMDNLMAKDPTQRYQTPAAAADALKPFLTPNAGATPAGARLVPEYRKWLETESGMLEAPKNLPPPQYVVPVPTPPRPAPPGPGPAPVAAPPAPRDAGRRSGGAGAAPVVKPAGSAAPARPAAPVGKPVKAVAPGEVEVDVELVVPAAPPPAPVQAHAPMIFPVPAAHPDDRPLWEFDRRDLIMVGAGGLGVLLAIGLGYGLAQVFRRKPEEPKDDEPK